MDPQRVLVVRNTQAGWSRGILRGFMASAHEHDWTLLHFHPESNVNWLSDEFQPAAAVVGPELGPEKLAKLAKAAIVSVTVDRSDEGIASVSLDEGEIAALALDHLLGTG